jgi:hypothetical protein
MQVPFVLNIYEGKELWFHLQINFSCEIIGKQKVKYLAKIIWCVSETATQGWIKF